MTQTQKKLLSTDFSAFFIWVTLSLLELKNFSIIIQWDTHEINAFAGYSTASKQAHQSRSEKKGAKRQAVDLERGGCLLKRAHPKTDRYLHSCISFDQVFSISGFDAVCTVECLFRRRWNNGTYVYSSMCNSWSDCFTFKRIVNAIVPM